MRDRAGMFGRTFVVAGVILMILAVLFVVTSTLREWHIVQVFGDQGSLYKSWIEYDEPSFLARLVGSRGRPYAVTLRGDDPALAEQVKAIQGLHDLRLITFDSVRANNLPDGDFQLPNVHELSFSSCEGDAVEVLISSISSLSSLRVYDSEDLSDNSLDGCRFLAEIRAIELDGTNVSGTFLRSFGTAKKLSSVTIRYSPVSLEAVRYLARLPAVERIVIDSPTSDISYTRAEALLKRKRFGADILLGGFGEQNENGTEMNGT